MKTLKKTGIVLLIFAMLLSGCGKAAQIETAESKVQETTVVDTEQDPATAGIQKIEAEQTDMSKELIIEDPEEPAESKPADLDEIQELTEEVVEEVYVDEAEVTVPEKNETEVLLSHTAPAVSVVLTPMASGESVVQNEEAVIDHSHTEDGYVMIQYLGATESRLKVQLKGPMTTYTYDLPKSGWNVFPFSDGNGDYQVVIYKNVTGTKYAMVLSAAVSVAMQNEFAPFLRPNQYVNFSEGSEVVKKGAELTTGIGDPLEKVEKVYDYVVANLTYDKEKATNVQSGYLPVLDQVLHEKRGICFDYAALMTAMLRSQNVPCKLIVGYAGETYHAWINVWTEESGWVDGAIFFDGHKWKRMDPTFASSGGQSAEIMDYISKDANYTVKYQY